MPAKDPSPTFAGALAFSAMLLLSQPLPGLAQSSPPGREAAATLEPSPTPTPSSSPSPTPDPPRIDPYGELVTRLDTMRQTYPGCVACPSRTRGRFRIRLGMEGRLVPGLRAVVGVGVGELNDPNTTYRTLGGNFSRQAVSWDRAYLAYNPPKARWLEVMAGKFPYPWSRSSMTFDVDLFPEGLSEKLSFDIGERGVLRNFSLQAFQLIVNEQPGGPDALIVGGQGVLRLRPAHNLTTSLSVTGLDFKRPEYLLRSQLGGTNLGTRNTNATVLRGGEAFYESGFRYSNVILEGTSQTPIESMPVTLALEYQRNLRSASPRDRGRSLRVEVGRRQKPATGDLEFTSSDWNRTRS